MLDNRPAHGGRRPQNRGGGRCRCRSRSGGRRRRVDGRNVLRGEGGQGERGGGKKQSGGAAVRGEVLFHIVRATNFGACRARLAADSALTCSARASKRTIDLA